MNINQLKYFVSVFEKQSFSMAAQSRSVTVQAVSKAIGDLEREFGDTLFTRSNHGAVPTQLGHDFYLRSKPVLESFEQLEAYVHGEKGSEEIGLAPYKAALASPNFANSDALCLAFSQFISQNVGLNIELSVVNPQTAQQSLEAHEFEAFVTIGSYSNPKTNCLTLGTLPTGIIVAKNHPLAQKQFVTLAELSEYPAGFSPICDSFNESILVSYQKAGLITNIETVESLAENDYEFMGKRQGYFFSALFPMGNNNEANFALIPINPNEALETPICSISLKNGTSTVWRAVEEFLKKAIGQAMRQRMSME